MNKKGDQFAFEEIIFIFLNIVYFAMLIFFVVKASSGAYISEQFYAKQIGLLIDNAKSGTLIAIDLTKPVSIAKKNNIDESKIVRIIGDSVVVQMSARAYGYQFFNEVNVQLAPAYRVVGEGKDKRIFLDIYIKEK